MQISLVTTEQQLDALESDWRRLQSGGGVRDISMTWEWIRTWWDVFKDGRQPHVLIGREAGVVVGIAPFVRREVKYLGGIIGARLELMASGEDEEDEICSDYLDLVVAPEGAVEFVDAMISYLSREDRGHWDEIVLAQMNVDSPAIKPMFEAARRHGFHIEEVLRTPCSFTPLPSTLDDYIAGLGRRTRKQIRRDMNRLEELGAVQYSVADNQEEVDKLSKTLIDLHQSRWESEGKPGVFSSDKYRSFHSRIMSTALERGWLRLGALKLDDNYLACEYNFSFNNKIYSYQSGVNIFKEWNLSIGTIADVYAIGNAISDGSAEYDFLAGASDYKVRLSKGEHHIVTIRVGKPSLKETLYQAAKRLKRFARRRVRRGS